MPRVSPIINSVNAGEFSPLMEGRVDLDRYPAAVRRLLNTLAVPQGPAIGRSGTKFVAPVYDHTQKSRLLRFEFATTSGFQVFQIEAAEQRFRFLTENGLVLRSVVTGVSLVELSPLRITAAGHGAAVGDSLFLAGFTSGHPINGFARVTAVVGDVLTLAHDFAVTTIPAALGTMTRIYHVAAPYLNTELQGIRAIQSRDVVYLFHGNHAFRSLSRFANTDWRLATLGMRDGPYLPNNDTATRLTPSATGNAVPLMTSNTLPSGTASADTNEANREPWRAFNSDPTIFWSSTADQSGFLQYQFPAPKVIRYYVIYLARDNVIVDFSLRDFAPKIFALWGSNDGANWTTLDSQNDYTVWDGNVSLLLDTKNKTPYTHYRLRIYAVSRQGAAHPRIGQLALVEDESTAPAITLTASGTTGINKDQGFLPTDVNRVIRLRGHDNLWRWAVITGWTSSTVVSVKLRGNPLPNLSPISDFRLGMWSDTTGWPTCAAFFEDRLWLAGARDNPDTVVSTRTGGYSPAELDFTPTDATGVVEDDHSIVAALNSVKIGAAVWIAPDEKGLLIGTINGEWVIRGADRQNAISARNIEARKVTARGCAAIEPVQIDKEVLYVQRSGRTLRELAYAYEADGYKSPSLTLFAQHVGVSKFVEVTYAAEPYSLVWICREDGRLLAFTYNKDEAVFGWSQHTIGGAGVVEAVSVLPSLDGDRDALWVIVQRTINGQARRYIEVLQPTWEIGFGLDNAWYVDSGLIYDGAPVTQITGLHHLEGATVAILADGSPIPLRTVTGGAVTLDFETSRAVIGLPFDAETELLRLNAGAADGTAQGKIKRIHAVVVRLWDSMGGEVGRPDQPFVPIDYRNPDSNLDDPLPLFTGDTDLIPWPLGNDKDATIIFRRSGDSPLPFNIIALMPRMDTQDGG